jgi:transposase
VFAKLKTQLRKVHARLVEDTWKSIGKILEDFHPAECANYLVNAGYGKYKSVHKRFTRWAKAGAWERIVEDLAGDPDNQYLMLDSTVVRAHNQAANGKRGPKIRLWGTPEED